ncbi:MAG: ImmA/IrrE family metallo-endopeptidase [Kiritimatiellales bacterium]|nr:ImmA/IrrE family metallo-endopeptidase [Kiritimatiellales bacterium]
MNELSKNLMRLRKMGGLTQQAVADAAGISRVAYRNLEKGEAEPREGTLQALAKALDASALELLASAPRLKSLRFRANPNMSVQEHALGEQLVMRSANWLRDFNELESMLGKTRRCVLKPTRKGTLPETAAAKVREELLGGNTSGCVPDFCELLENAGIKLFLSDFQLANLFGLSIGEADGGPAIAVNTGKSISVERQIFSMAHELGHLMLHKDTYGKDPEELDDDQQEREADRFAAAFLMPSDAFIAEWNENRGLHWVDAVLKTKRHFKVSYQSVLHQLIELGKAEHPTVYKQFRADYETRYGKKLHWKEEPPNHPVPQASSQPRTAGGPPAPPPSRIGEEPRNLDPLDLMEDRLGSLVRDALDRELITVSRAAEILDLRIEEMRDRMKSWEVVS